MLCKHNSKCQDSASSAELCQIRRRVRSMDVHTVCPFCVFGVVTLRWRALGVTFVTLLFFPLPSFKDWPSLSSRSGSYSPHSWKVQVHSPRPFHSHFDCSQLRIFCLVHLVALFGPVRGTSPFLDCSLSCSLSYAVFSFSECFRFD